MRYEINSTEVFDAWLAGLDSTVKRRLANRLLQVELGHFGDHKAVSENLFELRCFFGGGLRLYYTVQDGRVVLLLTGGDKDTQRRDIARASAMLLELKG
jgi:putative addiction module killer protein